MYENIVIVGLQVVLWKSWKFVWPGTESEDSTLCFACWPQHCWPATYFRWLEIMMLRNSFSFSSDSDQSPPIMWEHGKAVRLKWKYRLSVSVWLITEVCLCTLRLIMVPLTCTKCHGAVVPWMHIKTVYNKPCQPVLSVKRVTMNHESHDKTESKREGNWRVQ